MKHILRSLLLVLCSAIAAGASQHDSPSTKSETVEPGYRLLARIVDRVGEPIVGATWQLESRDARKFFDGGEILLTAEGVTGADGRVNVVMPPQAAWLRVQSPGLGSRMVEANPRALTSQCNLGDIRMTSGGDVLVTLPGDVSLSPAHGWHVGARYDARDGAWWAVRFHDVMPGESSVLLRDMPVGELHVRLLPAEGRPKRPLTGIKVDVIAGKRASVTLPGPGRTTAPPDIRWEMLGDRYLCWRASRSSMHFASDKVYVYHPKVRLLREGEVLVEGRSLHLPTDGYTTPLILEVESPAIQTWRSGPIDGYQTPVIRVRGHCSIRLDVKSAATKEVLRDVTVRITRSPHGLLKMHRLNKDGLLSGLPPEPFDLVVQTPGYAPLHTTVSKLQNHEERVVSLELLAPMPVEGFVELQGRPASILRVTLQRWVSNGWRAGRSGQWVNVGDTTTGVRGDFRFEAHEPGKHRIHVRNGSPPNSLEFETRPGQSVDVGTIQLESVALRTER